MIRYMRTDTIFANVHCQRTENKHVALVPPKAGVAGGQNVNTA
jgi:hypothetical protein